MKIFALAAFLFSIVFGNPVQANLITNGGFETGDFTGWTVTGPFLFVRTGGGNYGPHSGTFFAAGGPAGSLSFLSQSFTDTTGESLQIGFFVASNGDTPNQFTASYDGAPLLDLVNLPATGSGVPVPYMAETFSVAATGSDTLTFGFFDPPSVLALDDVSVNLVSSVPEPITLFLLATAMAGLVAARRRVWGAS